MPFTLIRPNAIWRASARSASPAASTASRLPCAKPCSVAIVIGSRTRHIAPDEAPAPDVEAEFAKSVFFGKKFAEMGEYSSAYEHLAKADALKPDQSAVVYNMAVVLARAQHHWHIDFGERPLAHVPNRRRSEQNDGAHARIARECGVPEVLTPVNGEVVKIGPGDAKMRASAPGGMALKPPLAHNLRSHQGE